MRRSFSRLKPPSRKEAAFCVTFASLGFLSLPLYFLGEGEILVLLGGITTLYAAAFSLLPLDSPIRRWQPGRRTRYFLTGALGVTVLVVIATFVTADPVYLAVWWGMQLIAIQVWLAAQMFWKKPRKSS